jgi:DNA invertase Pin-like site-specific DNA recombinase
LRQLEFLREGMPGVFAEFETNLRRERQMEGIARAKANGVYASKGRPASIDAARVREMKARGGGTEVAKALGSHRASVYRLLEGGRA